MDAWETKKVLRLLHEINDRGEGRSDSAQARWYCGLALALVLAVGLFARLDEVEKSCQTPHQLNARNR